MSDTTNIHWTDGRGKKQTRVINHIIDIRKFLGTPGYPLLVLAANTHLAVSVILMFLGLQDRETPGMERGRSWTTRRRRLFQQPDTVNAVGPTANADGNEARAVNIMRENTNLSARGLSRLLKEHGIARSAEWCLWHRCD